MTRKTDEEYAHDFLLVPTLTVRNSDSLDFHDVFVGCVRTMLTAIIKDRNLSYTEDDYVALVNGSLWDSTDGGAEVRNNDDYDFHYVSVNGLRHLFAKLQ